MNRPLYTLSTLTLAFALTGCPTLDQLTAQADAGAQLARVTEPDASALEADASLEDAGVVLEVDSSVSDAGEPDAALLEPDASTPDAGPPPSSVSYDFEGTWNVTLTPDLTKATTCGPGVQLPSASETWLVLRRDDTTMRVTDPASGIEGIATLGAPNTYSYSDTQIGGAVRWSVRLTAIGALEGTAWISLDTLSCAGSYTVQGTAH